MLFKDGISQGGGGTLGTATHTSGGIRRHYKNRIADSKMYRESAQRQCDIENAKQLKGE
jgi:hypothetical protein